MRVIINGKIRENKELFKSVEKWYSDHGARHAYEEFYIGNVKIDDDHDGNFHLDIDNVTDDVPEQIPQQMILGFSIVRGLEQTHRLCGIYTHGNARAIVEGVRNKSVTVRGTTAEEVRNLYCRIRAGKILPTENWESEQIKPSFWQGFRSAFSEIFSK